MTEQTKSLSAGEAREDDARVCRAAAGRSDSALLSALYRRCFATLAASIHRTYGAGPPDPEDVAQQAFEKLRARGDLHQVANLDGYLWISARNIIMSEKRAQRVRAGTRAEDVFWAPVCDKIDPARVLMAKQELGLVMQTLAKMPNRRRHIFMLHRLNGLTPEHAGQRCGVSRSSAVRHIALASAAIAAALAGEPM